MPRAGAGKVRGMDSTRILEADHRDVETLFAEIDKAEGAARRNLIEELTASLRAHMQLEEEVVYPLMQQVTGRKAAVEGTNEHDIARELLLEIERLGPDAPGVGAALEGLEAAITHHVDEEESDDFPTLRKDGQRQLEEMSTPFLHRRIELGMPLTAEALAAASTKPELVDEATNVGIEHASSLTKQELAEALADKMAAV